MSLSVLLQRRVKELDISISDLARRSGVSRATVIRMLGGKNEHYSVSNLQAVLTALGMQIDLLAVPSEAIDHAYAGKRSTRITGGQCNVCSGASGGH